MDWLRVMVRETYLLTGYWNNPDEGGLNPHSNGPNPIVIFEEWIRN